MSFFDLYVKIKSIVNGLPTPLALICLVSVFLSACASVDEPVTQTAKIKFVAPQNLRLELSQIQERSDFVETDPEVFKYKPAHVDLKIYKFHFADLKMAELYIQNRKLHLHQTFQNNIAPYFGVVELNQSCLSRARTEATDQKIDFDTTKFFMEFPVTARRVVSDCLVDNTTEIIHYELYVCRNEKLVYELRHYRYFLEPAPVFEITCQ